MGYLTRDEILKADDLPTREVQVPEWGGTVLVRTIEGWERDEFETSIAGVERAGIEPDHENIRARMVSLAVIDEKRQRLFSEDDVHQLGRKSPKALDRVYEAAIDLAGMKPDSKEKARGN